MKSRKTKKIISVFLSACMAIPLFSGGKPIPQLKVTGLAAAAASDHDDDLVLRYNTMAGYVSTDNAFNNDESFYKALPLGNGRIGAMAYGNYPDELIDLNECTVWSSGPGSNNREGGANHIKEIQDYIKNGKFNDANSLVGRYLIGGGEAKYQKVGALKLSFGHKDVTGYSRELDMNDAVARTVYTCNGIIIHRYNILNLRLINILRIDLHIYGISDITSLMVDLRIDTGNGICKVFCPAYLLNTELILDIRFIIILDTRIEHIIAVAYDAVCLSCDLICEKRTAEHDCNNKNDAEIP